MRTAPAAAGMILLHVACAAGELKSTNATPVRLTLFTRFERQYANGTVQQMRAEVNALLLAAGVEIEWRELDARSHSGTVPRLVVLTFQGRCEVDEDTQARPRGTALGWTHVSDGELLPFSDIDCDKVHRFVARQLVALKFHEQEVALGRAIGRVVAHELFHILAHTRSHVSEGVGRASYSAVELIDERFSLGETDSAMIRDALRPESGDADEAPATAWSDSSH